MISRSLAQSALISLTLNLAIIQHAFAQEKGEPPMVIPPPNVGDPIGTNPPPVDPEIVVPPPAVSPPPAVKPLDEHIFCSSVSLEEAMARCMEWTKRETGSCQNIGPSPKCKFQVKVVPMMNKLNKTKSK